jgi:hypothetical protein
LATASAARRRATDGCRWLFTSDRGICDNDVLILGLGNGLLNPAGILLVRSNTNLRCLGEPGTDCSLLFLACVRQETQDWRERRWVGRYEISHLRDQFGAASRVLLEDSTGIAKE